MRYEKREKISDGQMSTTTTHLNARDAESGIEAGARQRETTIIKLYTICKYCTRIINL